LPMIQRRNDGALVATQALARRLDIGVFYDHVDELGPLLRQREHMQALRARVWAARPLFTFDHHVPALVDFFRAVMVHI
jgi:hypothetical protein